MVYTKFIKYGDKFELYEYEREPVPRLSTGRRKKPPDDKGVGASREDPLSEEQVGKRQDNARRASMAFRRLVICNLSGSELPLLLTLTYKENIEDITVGYKDYRAFIQALRNKYGKDFRYVCVPEFQKRGAVHFHALVWGLPADVFLQERKTRSIAETWGRGFVFIKQTDANERLSSYLAKYMAKAFVDPRLKNKKAYVASRNVIRPVVGAGFSPSWPILDDYVGETKPILDRTYRTKWLGKGRHRIYKLDKQTNDLDRKTEEDRASI